MFEAGVARPIDFDDCGHGYLLHDLASALCFARLGNQYEQLRDGFLADYYLERALH